MAPYFFPSGIHPNSGSLYAVSHTCGDHGEVTVSSAMWLRAFSMEADIWQDIHLLYQSLDSNNGTHRSPLRPPHYDTVRAFLGLLAFYATSVTSLFPPWYSSFHYNKPSTRELFLVQATQNIFFALARILPIDFTFFFWNLKFKDFTFFNSAFCYVTLSLKYPISLS